MNMNFDLMELNSLYVATTLQLKKAQREAKRYPSDFFQTQLTIAEMLVEKIQTALYEKCDETGNLTDDVYESRLSDLENDLQVLEDELEYYVKIRDFDFAAAVSDRIEEVKEELDNLSK